MKLKVWMYVELVDGSAWEKVEKFYGGVPCDGDEVCTGELHFAVMGCNWRRDEAEDVIKPHLYLGEANWSATQLLEDGWIQTGFMSREESDEFIECAKRMMAR